MIMFTSLLLLIVLGEKIYCHEHYYEPGVYSINWIRSQTISAIPPGVYLYSLESDGQELVKKMVIH